MICVVGLAEGVSIRIIAHLIPQRLLGSQRRLEVRLFSLKIVCCHPFIYLGAREISNRKVLVGDDEDEQDSWDHTGRLGVESVLPCVVYDQLSR